MNTVWLAIEHVPYEFDHVMGVFSTEKKAQEFIDSYDKDENHYYEIVDYQVDEKERVND